MSSDMEFDRYQNILWSASWHIRLLLNIENLYILQNQKCGMSNMEIFKYPDFFILQSFKYRNLLTINVR